MKQFVLLLIVLASLQARAQWTTLFNGKNLDGWKQIAGKATYEIKDQEIVGSTVANSPNSFLITEKTYGDFILELEFKVTDNTNSGIQIRSESKPDYLEGRVHGYQVEIDPSPRAWSGGLYDESRRDWLYTLEYNPPAKAAYRKNDWNKVRVECIGPVIRTWLNDVPAANVVDNMTLKGFIALQVHAIGKPEEAGQQVRWRKIRIQTENLKPSPPDQLFVANFIPNFVSEQEKKNGVRLLWDGASTEGWRGAGKESFPAKGWTIANGTLNVLASAGGEAANGGDIVTVQEFGAMDFQFDFKLSEGANSGVKYFVTEKEKTSGSAIGLEYQILDDERHPDAKEGVGGNRTLASLYDLIPSIKVKRGIRKIGEWNQGRIVVYPDNRVEHWLNGYKVVEYQRGGPIYQALVARSKYAAWENFGLAEKGHILLQDHGNAVSFRSLKVRSLR